MVSGEKRWGAGRARVEERMAEPEGLQAGLAGLIADVCTTTKTHRDDDMLGTVELVGLGLALVVLLLASLATNAAFGHKTFHGQRQAFALPRPPPPTRTRPATTPSPPPPLPSPVAPDQLQAMLPQELLASEVLSFLTPYEVTQLLPTSKVLRRVGELPSLWQQAMARAGLLVEDDDDGQKGNEGLGRRSKLEFFRRMFLRPYDLARGHDTPDSCRVIIHSRVYDVTSFLYTHPGGEFVLMEHGGWVDATKVFELSYHSAQAREMMKAYLLWDPEEHLGRAGTIFGLFQAASPSSYASEKETSTSSFRASPPPLPVAWDDRRRLRRGGDRSPPSIVEALEGLRF